MDLAREATPAPRARRDRGGGRVSCRERRRGAEPRRTPSAAVGSGGSEESGGDAIRWRRAALAREARERRARARRHPPNPPPRGVCVPFKRSDTAGGGGAETRRGGEREARRARKRRERRESSPRARAGGDASLAVHARASSGARGLAHQPSARRCRDISTLNRFVTGMQSARVPPFSPPGRNALTSTPRRAARRWTLRRWTMTTGLVSFPPLSLARTRRGPSSDARYTSARRAAVGLECGSWGRDQECRWPDTTEEGKASRLEVFTILESLRNLDDMVRDILRTDLDVRLPKRRPYHPAGRGQLGGTSSTPNIFVSDRFDQPDQSIKPSAPPSPVTRDVAPPDRFDGYRVFPDSISHHNPAPLSVRLFSSIVRPRSRVGVGGVRPRDQNSPRRRWARFSSVESASPRPPERPAARSPPVPGDSIP